MPRAGADCAPPGAARAMESDVSDERQTPPSTELSKAYDHHDVEPRWYATWLARGYFHADENDRSRPAFSIVLPPPNVTGSLHLGHALTATIQDILIRWKRMSGFNVLWLPGTDHAGIATQMVVEKELQKTEKKSRHDLGREEFLRARLGRGRSSTAPASACSTRPSAPRSTGSASASPWTRGFPGRCGRSSSGSTRRGSSTGPRSSSTGARAASPRSPISR